MHYCFVQKIIFCGEWIINISMIGVYAVGTPIFWQDGRINIEYYYYFFLNKCTKEFSGSNQKKQSIQK